MKEKKIFRVNYDLPAKQNSQYSPIVPFRRQLLNGSYNLFHTLWIIFYSIKMIPQNIFFGVRPEFQIKTDSISGPLNHTIVSLVMLTISIFVAMISLLLSEMMLLKSIYAWKWSVMAMKDDNLISLLILTPIQYLVVC